MLGVPFTVGVLGIFLRFSFGPAAFPFGLVSLILAPALGLLGAILGHVALRQIKRTRQPGRGRAITGIVVGWVTMLVFALLVVLVAVLVSQLSR